MNKAEYLHLIKDEMVELNNLLSLTVKYKDEICNLIEKEECADHVENEND